MGFCSTFAIVDCCREDGLEHRATRIFVEGSGDGGSQRGRPPQLPGRPKKSIP